MSRLSRRSFFAASAMLAAGPAFSAPRKQPTPAPVPEVGRSGSVDVVMVGAGAAGIAAARRARRGRQALRAGRGGRHGRRPLHHRQQDLRRAVRSRRPLDLHCRHQSGGEARAADRARSSIRRRPASACASAGATRAKARWRIFSPRWCAPTAPSRTPPAAAPTSPARRRCRKDLGDWRPSIEFVLGPYGCGKDLREVSAVDFCRVGRARQRRVLPPGVRRAARQARAGLPVQLATPVTPDRMVARGRVESSRQRKGRFAARAVIVTVSTNVLTAGKIKFAPELPKRASRRRRQAQARQPTITWRWNSPAIRSGCAATSWCSRNRRATDRRDVRQCVGHRRSA